MRMIALFINRPVATTLLVVAAVLGGILGYINLPVADLPNVDFPVILINARQPGGSPEEVASSVAAPLEKHLGQIADVTEMTSQSTQNQVRIIMQFALNRDINGAARDVEAALQAARADLPTSLRENPTYFKANPSGSPIMVLALTSKTQPMPKLYDYATNVLEQRLSTIKGIGQVEIGGSSLPAVRVEMNPLPLFRRGIGFEDVRAALASANAHTPKGFVEEGTKRYQLETNDQAHEASAYRDLIIAYRNNAPVRLSDVADISDSVEDLRNAGYFNKEPAVLAIIFPQAGSNIIETIDQIKRQLPYLEESMPNDMKLHIAIDRSLTIRASVADTQFTLIVSVFLVVMVVLVFLRKLRSTFIPAIVVPASIIGTFGIMHMLGYSIDNLSLMALTISTGFVVDDAIVVLENITRYMEEGYSPHQAALYGAGEVAFTVLSITISLIAVFIPILLLGGIAGRLFHEFAMTLSATLLISMVLSLTLTPMMCAYVLLPHDKDLGPHKNIASRISASIETVLNLIFVAYSHSLDWALRHKIIVILSVPATIALMIYLFLIMPKGFFPDEDTGLLIARLRGDQSISFQSMKTKLLDTQTAILKDQDVESVAAFTGGRAVNNASLFMQLKDKGERSDTTTDTIARISHRLRHMVGAQFFMFAPGGIRTGGRQSNAAYQYTLQSDTAAELYRWMPKLVEALKKHKELRDISSDIEQGASSINLQIDRDTSARVQITPQLISNTIYDAFGQRAASVIYNPLNQYRVVMEVAPRFWQDPSILHQMWVSTAGGSARGGTVSNTIRVPTPQTASSAATLSSQDFRNQIANSLAGGKSASTGSAVSTRAETLVPLSLVTATKPTLTPLSVNHQGQSVATTLSFNLAKGASLSDAVQIIDAEKVKLRVPPSIHGSFAGNAAQYQQSVSNEPILILAALAAVYITLGILYESYIHPLTILSTLPSAGVGALLALQLFGEEFSLMAMIGVILLIGIVKKNAIMLVDFAIHAEREENLSPLQAIHKAALLRFRPIIMTTLAAALGALPLIFGHGYGSELRLPLGIAIVGGLIVSQALTLYTTPVIYLFLDAYSQWQKRYFRRLFIRWLPHKQDI